MTCKEARQRWQRRLDLGGSDAALDGHLAACEECRAYAARMERLVGLLDELREDTEQLAPPVIAAGLRSTPPHQQAWSTPGARNLLRIAATIVIVVGAGLWFRTPNGLMVENRTTEPAAGAVQGITLRGVTLEQFIAVASPSAEPNVQTYWLYPMATVADSRNRS